MVHLKMQNLLYHTLYIRFQFFQGVGDWDTCVKNVTSLLTGAVTNSKCYVQKCLFGLVRTPPISLSEIELYGFSEYWFSLENVLSVGGRYDFSKTASKARQFCRMKWSTILVCYMDIVNCSILFMLSFIGL